ncbi:hypothetical protein [Enterobacter asburiae]|uniref:hypothetical protein n=1 Tax=Enterobacter asburiae TaxID=61645 RepID=UPI00192B4FC0|nr:hypothetical protein [Enterobacter asburiae]MBL5924727.1 hypothetical protein [Enterobacter asburiae]MBL5955514.1 hypothetical protein [Enterobacter asburiae]
MDETQKEAGRALAFIRYVNTWKKLVIFMVLVTFCTSVYALWEYRRELTFWAMASFGNPRIDEDRLEPEMTAMIADTGALSVAVWSVNLESNQRRALFVRIRNERLINLEGTGDLALRPYSKLTAEIIELINSKTKCWPHVANTVVGKSARDAGVKWVCAAAIPPQFGTMIGMLAVGFPEQPENEDYVKMRIRQAAERVIK